MKYNMVYEFLLPEHIAVIEAAGFYMKNNLFRRDSEDGSEYEIIANSYIAIEKYGIFSDGEDGYEDWYIKTDYETIEILLKNI